MTRGESCRRVRLDKDMETDRQMLQRKLRQMSESERSRTGWLLFAFGLVLLILGVWFNHYANFPATESVTFPSDQAATFVAGDTVIFERQMRTVDATPTVDPTLAQATVKLTVNVSPGDGRRDFWHCGVSPELESK